MHSIRLHGPWGCEALSRAAPSNSRRVGSDASLPPPCRIWVPGSWSEALGDGFRGRARFTRRFHSPTGLAEGQRVWLCMDRVESSGTVSLNGQTLGAAAAAGGPYRFDVTRMLAANNQLAIEVESLDRSGYLGSVRLEIEEHGA